MNIFGFDLLDTDARFERYQEGMEVVTRLLQSDVPVTFDGKLLSIARCHPSCRGRSGPAGRGF